MSNILSKKDRYLIKWVGRCQYDTHDKIWGWFKYFQFGYNTITDIQPVCYTFWARTGKAINFKTHQFDSWRMARLVNQKTSKSYKKISESELEAIWPSFYDDIELRFVFHVLSHNS